MNEILKIIGLGGIGLLLARENSLIPSTVNGFLVKILDKLPIITIPFFNKTESGFVKIKVSSKEFMQILIDCHFCYVFHVIYWGYFVQYGIYGIGVAWLFSIIFNKIYDAYFS